MRAPLAVLAFSAFVASVPAPTVDVYLIGDSTMADKPNPETNPERGWGQLFPRFFSEDVRVHNHAVNGRSTKSFIDEGRWTAVLRDLKAGDYVFIEFGHNDEKSEDSTRYAEAHTGYKRNLERFIAETRARGATPVLLTPIVRRKFDARGMLTETHGDYPAVAREVAKATGVAFVDLESLSRSLVSSAGPEWSKQLYVWVDSGTSTMYPAGRRDDTHLSLTGADEIARLAATAVQQSQLPLAKYMRLAPGIAGESLPQPLWSPRPDGARGDGVDDVPTITPFLVRAKPGSAPTSAVVVFPGGGYSHVAIEKEGVAAALWLNSLGISAFVVRYRLGPKYHHPVMMLDGQRAIRLVRANAKQWNVDPARVGILGFSAGGHLASTLGTHFDSATRPALMMLVYPVITMDMRLTHKGSRTNLLAADTSAAVLRLLSNETQVTRETPPTFIVAGTDDAAVPVQNSQMFYDALRAAGVPAELHLFESGRHGFGLATADPSVSAWTRLAGQWLRRRGWAASQ